MFHYCYLSTLRCLSTLMHTAHLLSCILLIYCSLFLLICLHTNTQGTGHGTSHTTGTGPGTGSGTGPGSGSGSRHKIALENMFTPPSEREIKALFDGLAVPHDGNGQGHSYGRGHGQSRGHGDAVSAPDLSSGLKASSQSQSQSQLQSHVVNGVNGVKWNINGVDEHESTEKDCERSVQCRYPSGPYTDIESGNQVEKREILTYFWNFKSYFSRTKKTAKVSFSYNTKGDRHFCNLFTVHFCNLFSF
jgi:hypothetical protein